MRKKIISNALILSTLFLSGCSTINSTAHKLGINFWSHELQKAPCKFASTASDISYLECIGEKIPQPDEGEVIRLRGLYSYTI